MSDAAELHRQYEVVREAITDATEIVQVTGLPPEPEVTEFGRQSTGVTRTAQLLNGAAIRIRRHDARWTLEDLSFATGLSVSFLNDLEHGRSDGSIRSLVNISRALACTPTDLLHWEPTHV